MLHAASPPRLAEGLPIVVEAVDSEAKIPSVLSKVSEMVGDGLVTLEDIEVVSHLPRQADGGANDPRS